MAAPVFIGWLISALGSAIGSFIFRATTFLGVNLAAYEFAVEPLITYVQAVWVGLPGDLVAYLAFFRVDQFLTIVLSAMAVRVGMRVAVVRIGQ
jgi:hypothetical protein